MATDIALIIFTSGTSTLPKACPHTSDSLWASQVAQNQIESAHSLVQHLPNSHIFAVCAGLSSWSAGGSVIFPAPSFSPATTLEAIDGEQATHVCAVPSLLLALMGHSSFDKAKMRSLQRIVMARTVISPMIVAMVEGNFGVNVSILFGLSEASPILDHLPNDSNSYQHGFASVGRAVPGLISRFATPRHERFSQGT